MEGQAPAAGLAVQVQSRYQAYSAGAHQISYPEYIEDMTEEERAVMEAPCMRR